jgi:hypothetical protein
VGRSTALGSARTTGLNARLAHAIGEIHDSCLMLRKHRRCRPTLVVIFRLENADEQSRASIHIAIDPAAVKSGNPVRETIARCFKQICKFVEFPRLGREAVDENEWPQWTVLRLNSILIGPVWHDSISDCRSALLITEAFRLRRAWS